jgi:hypothetical protein
MIPKIDFKINTWVYLKSDPEQWQRLVTGVIILESGMQYRLTCGTEETDHWTCEISKEKNPIYI